MDGIINVYKEKGMTSFDVTFKLRSILSEKKIGHAGTLDPMAEGVLVVCAGKATKLVDNISIGEKEYEAEMVLGIETDTEDITGEILKKNEVLISESEIREVLNSMIGECDQIPPMYSAKKQNGKRLYELARKGQVVERKANHIQIYDIKIHEIRFPNSEEGAVSQEKEELFHDLPRVRFTVRCSKGTYVRTICADAGKKLGCGAAMSSLKRTKVGAFTLEKSFHISELQELKESGNLWTAVMPPIYVPEDTAVAFGKFDGGHRGHQLIFEKLFEVAKKNNLKTAVLTFSQNPDNVVKGENRPGISTNQEHLSRLKTWGFDYIFEFPMTKETMRIPADVFLKEVLIDEMRARAIVAGTDCSFGYKAQGNVALLEKYEEDYNYSLHIVEKMTVKDSDGSLREISSTLIKEKIQSGEMDLVHDWLGRYFSIAGVVVHGKQLGGPVLSFPTANINPTNGKVIPAVGVYVTRVFIDSSLYWGMTNVGNNPTVSVENPVNIETHVLDYTEDLYGKKIRVDFLHRIRGQKKFDSMEDLREQLLKDRETVREFASEYENKKD